MTCEKRFLSAAIAQFCGVTLALFGCLGVVLGSGLWQRLVVKIGVLGPFSIAYGICFIGFFFLLCNYGKEGKCEQIYTWFVPSCLYLDAILLPVMIGCTGGMKQSIFCPLFLTVPAVAVVFLPRPAVSLIQSVGSVTFLTLIGYLLVYWLAVDTTDPASLIYRILECLVLCGSVILTVVMHMNIPPLYCKNGSSAVTTEDPLSSQI